MKNYIVTLIVDRWATEDLTERKSLKIKRIIILSGTKSQGVIRLVLRKPAKFSKNTPY